MEELVQINLEDLSIRCKSKKELYDLLTHDCGLYLPPLQHANAQYIRGVVTGKTKFLRTENVKQIQVIQIESITIERIISFAKSKFDLDEYLPIYRKYRHPDRTWLCNLVYSLVGAEFKQWIQKKMAEREKNILLKRRFHLKVLPELAEAIEGSHRVSLLPGRSHFLLRQPSHKRVKICDLEEIIASRNQNDTENAQLYTEVQDLKEKLKEFRMVQIENLQYREMIEKLEKEREQENVDEERIQF